MGHTHSHVYLHVVFATHNREPLLADDLGPRVHAYLTAVLRNQGCAVIAVNGAADHVHLLFHLAPDRSYSYLVRDLKANSSGWIHRTVPNLRGFAWQEGYGVFSVASSGVARVKAYIASQEEHHRKRTFAEEYEALMRLHAAIVPISDDNEK